MTRAETAVALFSNGNNCAQAVFAAFKDLTNIDRESSFKIAYALGGAWDAPTAYAALFQGRCLS